VPGARSAIVVDTFAFVVPDPAFAEAVLEP
jgi:hypothetical protein